MKKWLKKCIPTDSIKKTKEIKILKPFLHSEELRSFDEQCVARGVAAGLAGAVIPGFQLLYAAILVILFRGNLYIALLATLVTNPLTVIPIMFGICYVGSTVVGNGSNSCIVHQFQWDFSSFSVFWKNLTEWGLQFGKAFAVGVPIASFCLAIIGYFGTLFIWRTFRFLSQKMK